MILIADSGSTKTDWAWIENGSIVHRATTAGINPVHQTEEEIEKVVLQLFPRKEEGERSKEICTEHMATDLYTLSLEYSPSSFILPPSSKNTSLKWVFFYGSGCIPEKKGVVEKVLRKVFPEFEKIEVENDLLGASRAVCQHQEGLACILGTGSNSCYYDGAEIVENIPPLGYILGDEGSGAVLGKLFLNALFKGSLPASMKEDFLQKSGLTYPEIIQRVYREPMANRFLASTSLFIYEHLDVPALRELVKDNFRAFFRKNIAKYKRPDLSIGAIGSIAYHYRDLLQEVATEEGYTLSKVAKSPMEGLVAFHGATPGPSKRRGIGID
ncbi:MAG: ATPase [Prevotella sp.]|nr:ATPase [Prevotella sp.]